MIDNHVHTAYSADSEAKPLDIIARAKEAGLSGVCFTDHWDVGFESINEEKIIPYDYARCKELRNLRRDGGGFNVYCGIELGPMSHALDRVKAEMADAGFDFVLLSAHYVDDVPQLHYKSFFEGRAKKDAYDRYLSTLISLITLYGDYDALGHFDYISRYSPYDEPLMMYNEQAEKFDELFSLLIKQGKALEVNTYKHRPRQRGLPVERGLPLDKHVLKRYRELGGELIMLGSDAHRAADTGYMFGAYREALLDCGFSSVVHYSGRKPVFTNL